MEKRRRVVIYSYSCADAYVLSLNESQVKLLDFLSDKNIIDSSDFSWTDSVTDMDMEVQKIRAETPLFLCKITY